MTPEQEEALIARITQSVVRAVEASRAAERPAPAQVANRMAEVLQAVNWWDAVNRIMADVQFMQEVARDSNHEWRVRVLLLEMEPRIAALRRLVAEYDRAVKVLSE